MLKKKIFFSRNFLGFIYLKKKNIINFILNLYVKTKI
jgi:hypothetical protein